VFNTGLIFLNGQYVLGTTNLSGPSVLTSFTIPSTANFVSGINHLDFVVVNQVSSPLTAGPTGLRVEGLSGSSPHIPEPSTIVLAGIGFAGLVALRLRRGRKS
jgi:hypothetical protein